MRTAGEVFGSQLHRFAWPEAFLLPRRSLRSPATDARRNLAMAEPACRSSRFATHAGHNKTVPIKSRFTIVRRGISASFVAHWNVVVVDALSLLPVRG
jgi:hypothetical protein